MMLSDLDCEEPAVPQRPSLAWYAQAAGVFGATTCVIAGVFVIALTGGWATFDSGAAASPRGDLRDGQFYEQRWVNPHTGMPYAAQVDEVSTDYAALNDRGEDLGLTEDLAGAEPADAPERYIEMSDPSDAPLDYETLDYSAPVEERASDPKPDGMKA